MNASGEVIVVDDHFSGSHLGIEQIQFADGTIWSRTQIEAATPFEGTEANDTINGSSVNDTIRAKGGDDTVNAGDGNDTLTGGTGNDILRGGYGDDVYRYSSGDGNDLIDEDGYGFSTDKLILANLNAADVTFVRAAIDFNDLRITVNASGEVIVVDDHFSGSHLGIEQIQFADGTIWSRTQIEAATPFEGTEGNDTINGSNVNDTIRAKGGDDTVNAGDGNDLIDENGYGFNTDKLVLTSLNGSDVNFARTTADLNDLHITVNASGEVITIDDHFTGSALGIEQVQFADGTIWDRNAILSNSWLKGTSGNDSLVGTSQAETFEGLAGDDTLTGNGGNDVFVFKPGFGNDIIVDFTAGSGAGDVIEFDTSQFADFAAVLANAAQVGSDTVITFDASHKVTLQNVALANLAADDFRHV